MLSFLVFARFDKTRGAAKPDLDVLLHDIDRGTHRTEQPNDCKDCESQSDLGSTIARELVKRSEPCLVLCRRRKLRCQTKPINGGEQQHQAENDDLEGQKLSVFGEEQRVN